MNRAIAGILFLFLGPVLSLALGFITYFTLDFSYGAGGNTDGRSTPAQQYYSSIARPAGEWIVIGGVVLSFWLACLTVSKRKTTVH